MQPRSAYVHVPFCRHRCGYCNFTVVQGRHDLVDDYLQAIEIEMSWLGSPQEVDTLFLGGGTPTQLSLEELRRLLEITTRWFLPAENCEFSVEANPSDINPRKIELLAEFGVSRISLGAQSFQEQKLKILERDHRASEIECATELAKKHIASVSLDLIFGCPGESFESWSDDLSKVLRLSPSHVSTYGLTFERGAMFWGRLLRGELARTEEELERSMYLHAIDRLTAAGFEHYEVSNFARSGHLCRHNDGYWSGRSYYAVGPGAARFVEGIREVNHRSTTTYLKLILAGKSAVTESERLAPEDAARERLVFGLRKLAGLDRKKFAQETGFEINALVGNELLRFVELGLLKDDGENVRLTRQGLLVSDSLWPDFLSS